MTTLAVLIREQALEAIDFLKIDTEGYDLFVLQGFPWESGVRPGAIVCEFEDAKTLNLGYSFHDMAGFLVDRGYRVWVSEWHPVLRYGVRHDWRSLARYPCELGADDAWGNLLAFGPSVSDADVAAGVTAALHSKRLDRRVVRAVRNPGKALFALVRAARSALGHKHLNG